MYIKVPKSITCFGVLTSFEAYCQLGHPSLPILKKLCPEFQNVPSLECESCQFDKHHHLPFVSCINKRASFPFELVHSDDLGLCPIESKTRF